MAREPGKLAPAAWRADADARRAYLAYLHGTGDSELAAFYLRHPVAMEARVFAFQRHGARPLPSRAVVLEEARAVADRERGRLDQVERVARVVARASFGAESQEAVEASVDEWWRERMACLRRLDLRPGRRR